MPSDATSDANQDSSHLNGEEKRWQRDKFGSEYAFLILHGLSIYSEEDRREGRAILRSLMEAEEPDTSSSAADKSGKANEANNQEPLVDENDDDDSWVNEEYNVHYRLGYSEDFIKDLRAEWGEEFGDDFAQDFPEEDCEQDHGDDYEGDPWAHELGDEDLESATWAR